MQIESRHLPPLSFPDDDIEAGAPKKRRRAREKVRRFVVLTPLTSPLVLRARPRDLPASRLTSPLSRRFFPRFLAACLSGVPSSLTLPCSRGCSRAGIHRLGPNVAINSAEVPSADAGGRYPKCRRIRCFRAFNGDKRLHGPVPVGERERECVSPRRNQFRAQIPYL